MARRALYELTLVSRGLLLTRENSGRFVWEFVETARLGSPAGVVYGDLLREHDRKHEPNETSYLYDLSENQLFVDRSDIEPDGFVWACHEDRYRVEPIDNNKLWLVCLAE